VGGEAWLREMSRMCGRSRLDTTTGVVRLDMCLLSLVRMFLSIRKGTGLSRAYIGCFSKHSVRTVDIVSDYSERLW
jgi:hypothetical protein